MSLRERWWRTVRVAALPALWALSAAFMVSDAIRDPYLPERRGTSAYFHNHQGALLQGLTASLVELAVILAIVRPWTYRRSWGRAVATVAVLLPWTALSGMSLMHAGGILFIHFWWLACLVVSFTVASVWSGWAAWRAARPAASSGGDPSGPSLRAPG